MFWRRRRTTSTSASTSRTAIMSIKVPIMANIEWALRFRLDDELGEARKAGIKSSKFQLWAPSRELMVDETAGPELVCTM